MDFGMSSYIGMIATSTSAYLEAFAPVFLLIGGIVLGMGVLEMILDRFFPQKESSQETHQ